MLIAGVIGICALLLVLAFVAPRLSRGPQRGVNRGLGAGQRGASKAPGPLGRWFSKPFGKSITATDKSAEAGRNARSKTPV
jgi:hypothetical protein